MHLSKSIVLSIAVLAPLVVTPALAQPLEAHAPPVQSDADASIPAIGREIFVGGSLLSASLIVSFTHRDRPQAGSISIVSFIGLGSVTGSIVLMHGAARLRVARRLARGEPIELVRASELRRGRRELVWSGALFGSSLALGLGAGLARGGSESIAGRLTAFGFVGAMGAAATLLMSHSVYRVRFGRRNDAPSMAWWPSVSSVPGGLMLGVGALY